MRIIFEPFVYDPHFSGSGSGSIRPLRSAGNEAANSGVNVIRSLSSRTTTRGFYKTSNIGSGIANLITPYTYGNQLGSNYGIAIIRGTMRTVGVDNLFDVLRDGSGIADLTSKITTIGLGTSATFYNAVNTLRCLNSYGQEAAGNYGVARLAQPTTNNNVFGASFYGTAFATITQPYSYIYAFAGAAEAEAEDMFTCADDIQSFFVYGVVERALFNAVLTPQTIRQAVVIESVLIKDKAARLFEELIAEGLVLAEDQVAMISQLIALVDTVMLNDVNITQRMAIAEVAELLTVINVLNSVVLGEITDVLSVQEAIDARVAAIAYVIDSMTMQDTGLGLAMVTVALTDELNVEGAVLTTQLFYALLEERLNFSVSLSLDGLPYLGICMNATNKAITEYQPYDFNSLAVMQGVLYGANDAGLFRLDGATDDAVNINAYARTALTRIADGRMSQVDSAYLGYSSDGIIQLKAITTSATGAKTSRVYQLNAQNADANRSGRIKLGKGIKSVYWAFEVSNSLGADFTIDVIELRALALSRRI